MKTLPVAIVFGLFGAMAVSVALHVGWPSWVMFMAWVSFYIFGKTWLNSARAFLQMMSGMTMAMLIQLTAGFLSNDLGVLGFPVSVFLYIGSLAYIGRIKGLNNIPAWFFGMIIFFGVHPELELFSLFALIAPIVAGFIFAWLNNLVVEKLQHEQQQDIA